MSALDLASVHFELDVPVYGVITFGKRQHKLTKILRLSIVL